MNKFRITPVENSNAYNTDAFKAEPDVDEKKRPELREAVRAFSIGATDYANRITGLRLDSPRIRLGSDISREEWNHAYEGNELDYLFGYLKARYHRKTKSILLDDRIIDSENMTMRLSGHSMPVIVGVEEVVYHECTHYIRHITGANKRTYYNMDSKKSNRDSSLDESGAIFVERTYSVNNKNSVEDIIRSLYNTNNRYKGALRHLQETHEMLGTMGFLHRNKRFVDIIKNHNDVPEVEENDGHLAGLNFAVLIYASNHFDIGRTTKKLMTYNCSALVKELKEAARPSLRDDIDKLAKIRLM